MKRDQRVRRQNEEAFKETPRILSSEEKRGLILAHAAARQPKDPLQRATLWGGVVIAVLAVAAGWYVTVGYQVKAEFNGAGDDLRQLTEELDAFTERAKTNPIVNPPGDAAAEAAARFGEAMGEILNEDASPTSTRRNDLLAPSAPSASSTTETPDDAEEDPSDPPVDPNAPGLIPGSL
jgi:hypothetical protein